MTDLSIPYHELVELIYLSENQISSDLHETFMLFVKRLQKVVNFHAIGLFCPDQHESKQFTLQTHFGFQAYLEQLSELPVLNEIYTWVINQGKMICLPSDLSPGHNDLLLPLYQFKKNLGVLHVITTVEPLQVSQHQQVVLKYFAHQMSQSLVYVNMLQKQEMDLKLEKVHEMGLMLSGILHELNSPLTSIYGYLELLNQDLSKQLPTYSENAQEYLAVLSRESRRVTDMVRSLLKYVRHQPLAFEPLDMHDLLAQSLQILKSELTEIDIYWSLNAEQTWVNGEYSQLQQVLLNILNNAIQAFQENKIQTQQIWLTTYSIDKQFILKIQDNAGGISLQHAVHIFEPFYTTKSSSQGTGLGLNLAYKIMKAHQGEINHYNSLNPHGACFEIKLPLLQSKDNISQKPINDEVVEAGKSTGRILVIDNELPILHYLQAILEKQGYQVLISNSGEKSIDLMRKNRFDLIISDFFLVDMNGQELFENYQVNFSERTDAVLFLTGAILEPVFQQFLHKNHLQCLYKPFYADELLKMIEQILTPAREIVEIDEH